MLAVIQKSSAIDDWPVSADGGDNKEALLERILRNPRLPSPPTLALQVFQKSSQEDCKIGEISELLGHDPGLSAKLLKTLNSAIYARSNPVTSVRQAVTLLGCRPLRSLILGLALPVMQTGVGADSGLRRFWKKSVAGAVMARELAIRCKFPAPDDDMAASLLRDLGMILIRQNFQENYDPIWTEEVAIHTADQCDWEERCLGVHHAEVGAVLLERWQLPMEIVEPIRFHHQPEQLPALVKLLVDRVYLLDFVSRLAELEDRCHSGERMDRILQTARLRYSLERVDLERYLADVRPKIEDFSTILGVNIDGCPNFDELLATGCEELVRIVVDGAAKPESGRPDAGFIGTVDQSIGNTGRVQRLLDEPGNVKPGSKILQYDVVQVIGRGAMGIVFEALDSGLNRQVAIKLLAPELAGSEKARQRFALEARFAATLRHENVVAVHSVNELDGLPFLVMEFVDGSSLGGLLEVGRTFSVSEIARIGRQTALGLAAAHEARLIHRDIKPDNILLEKGTLHVRVADFGLARAVDQDFHLSQPGLLLGTPNFMSPEQVDGKTVTAASDLFSLGSVLYTLCTGHLPFQAESLSGLLHAVAEKAPTPVRELNPKIPEGLTQILEKLHAKNPVDRPRSAAGVAESLKPWCE